MAIPVESSDTKLPVEGRMPPLDAVAWINTPPLTAEALRGKVVLVDFWTYTCINWRRTVPWLRAWAEKYRDAGLVIVGVHTPEFSFERDLAHVTRNAREQDIRYPIAVDSAYTIWNAFGNQYWPALYFVDALGRIRYREFGEGNYDNLENVIRQLLAEAGHATDAHRARIDARGVELSADWTQLRSPETYLGYERSDGNVSSGGTLFGNTGFFAIPDRLRLNRWALAGNWSLKPEHAQSNDAPGRVAFQFHARDVHLVMGPALGDKPVRFRVTLDGKPTGAASGVDVDADGRGIADQPRMYHLVRQPGKIEDRRVEIEFLDAGVQLFVFTFG